MPEPSVDEIVAACTRFLQPHGRITVRQRMQEIADDERSLIRNDMYGKGGVVADAEARFAEVLGKEASVFMPSGTMAQQIAARIWSDRAGTKNIAFHPTCHLYIHEQMAYRELHGLKEILAGEADALMTPQEVADIQEPLAMLLIELPQREIGGQLPAWDTLVETCEIARAKGARLHLDGARLWECGPFYGRSYAEIAGLFDTVYVSMYKMLNGLPGAVLAGPKDVIDEARIWQRRHGGNLQNQAASAIAGLIGLERYVPRMPLYVAKAAEVAAVLRQFPQVRLVPEFPKTNMMHAYLHGDPDRLLKASMRIAWEEKVGLFFWISPDGKLEIAVGEASLGLEKPELTNLFTRLFELAAEPAP